MKKAFLIPLLVSGFALAGDAPVRRLADVPAHPIAAGKGSAQILFGASSGSPDAALTLLVLQPGAEVPEHVHESSAELLHVLEGEAAMTLDGAPLSVKAGEAVRIPKGARHTARVVGDKPLRALQVYAPAGPEQRFLPKH